MPQPTTGSLHIDTWLTNLTIGYSNKEYIADQIFPIVQVNKQSDIIPVYDQSFWFRDNAALRATGTASVGNGWTVNNSNKYFCDRYSLRKEIADETRDNADAPWNLDMEAAKFVTNALQLSRENSFSTNLFKTGVWGADKVGATDFTKWSDYGNSTPLVDVTAYYDVIESTIGASPNTFVMGKDVWSQLKWHPDILDTIKYTERALAGPELLASLLELPKVFIGRAIKTTTAEGTAESSVTYSRIWGKNALLMYVPDAPSLMTPAAGYTFVWNRVAGAINYIKRMRNEEREVDIIEANSFYSQVKTLANAGVFLSNAVA